jgi:hypothetical protein
MEAARKTFGAREVLKLKVKEKLRHIPKLLFIQGNSKELRTFDVESREF